MFTSIIKSGIASFLSGSLLNISFSSEGILFKELLNPEVFIFPSDVLAGFSNDLVLLMMFTVLLWLFVRFILETFSIFLFSKIKFVKKQIFFKFNLEKYFLL